MEQDDPQIEALRKQIREDLAGTTAAPKKKRMGIAYILFTTFCLLTPFAAYAVFIYVAHGFHDPAEFQHWLGECFRSKCPP